MQRIRFRVGYLPEVTNGMITVPPGPGLGMALHPDLDRAFTTSRRVSRADAI
jgi:galactonate dehydratase